MTFWAVSDLNRDELAEFAAALHHGRSRLSKLKS